MSELNVSWWDRFLLGLAPNWGLNRLKSRAAIRNYEAAGTGRRTSGWSRSSTDANAANATSIPVLRELSRDLRRNNGWAKRAIQVISAKTVGGWGIAATATSKNENLNAQAMDLWRAWAETKRCDFDGRLTFAGIQRLVMDTIVESGEALIIKESASGDDGLPVPIRIRVVEPDFLDTTRQSETKDGHTISQGIEFDGRGRRVAYYLYRQHPGAVGLAGFARLGLQSIRVPAEDVIHIYQVDRPGQMRGVPWLCAAISKLNDFDDYDDARLMQAKVAACFGAFVTDVDPASGALGEQDEDDANLETLEPGHIAYLPPGKEVSFASPPSVSDHGSFSQTQLRRIAASMGGITYEEMTGDYSQVNFSSARMAQIAHQPVIHGWRWEMLIPQLCDGVWLWVMELAKSTKGWPEVPGAKWNPPPMPMINPEKEGLAYQRLMRNGVQTLPDVIRERGEDPVRHLLEISESNKQLDALGIILDSDPRKTSLAGGIQPDEIKTNPAD